MRAVVMLGVALVLAPACGPKDDGFRAKLAQGCHSTKECTALVEEARKRDSECFRRTLSCHDQERDKLTASDLLDKQVAKDDAAQREAEAEDLAVQQQIRQFERQKNMSCDDLDAFESLTTKLDPTLSAIYRRMITKRRDDRIQELDDGLAAQLAVEPDLSHVEAARSELPAKIAAGQKFVDDMRCYSAASAEAAQLRVDASAQRLETMVSAEERCMADTKCASDHQFGGPLCNAIADKRQAVADRDEAARKLARERTNPSGYLDKTILHDLGASIQDASDRIAADDKTIASLRAKYTAATHTPFNSESCPKSP